MSGTSGQSKEQSFRPEVVGTVSKHRVYLLTQHRLLRDALSRLLAAKNDISVVGSKSMSQASIDEIVAATPDVLLTDSLTTSPGRIDFVEKLRAKLSRIKLVVIGMEPDPQQFLQVIQEGIFGYLVTDASSQEVIAAVRTVASGGAVCSSAFCACLFHLVRRQHQMPSFRVHQTLGLSCREQQLVGLIARGLTNKEIAVQLCLAENTVRNHIHRMLRKTGVNHRHAIADICRIDGSISLVAATVPSDNTSNVVLSKRSA